MNHRRISFLVLVIVGCLIPPPIVLADQQLAESIASELPVCVGFNSETQLWGEMGAVNRQSGKYREYEYCPKDYAVFSVFISSGGRRAGKHVHLQGNCCPLPKDILTEEHSFHEEKCPTDAIITGIHVPDFKELNKCDSPEPRYCQNLSEKKKFFIRCTQINVERYQLATSEPSLNVGMFYHFRTYFDKRTSKARIPAGFRYSVGRRGRYVLLDGSSCVGYPWGSIFVAKTSKYCEGFLTSQIQYRGAAGDPAEGSVVEVFPRCIAIDDPLSTNPVCIK